MTRNSPLRRTTLRSRGLRAGILAILCLAVGLGGAQTASAGTAMNQFGGRIENTELDTYTHHLYSKVLTGGAYVKPWVWDGYKWKTQEHWYGPNIRLEFDSVNVTNYAEVAVEFTKFYPGYGWVKLTEHDKPMFFSSAGLAAARAAQSGFIAGGIMASASGVVY
jgi:hypothetical protein